jgi:putative RecB family exonuclease
MKIIDNARDVEEPKVQIIKLSASSVKTYEQCPRKYYYTYINKQPTKEWDHFDLGNICHKTLEIFHDIYMQEGAKKGSLSKLMGYSFKKAAAEYTKILGPAMMAEAKELLAEYLKTISKSMPTVKSVEADFSFNISDKVLIRGYVDRLDIMKDARYHIVDYKTTKNARYLDPFQLKLYGIWLKEQVDPSVNSFKASYVLLRHKSKLKEYEFNIEDINKTKEELLVYAEKISTENTWMPIPTRLCDWCDFKAICPAHQDGGGW